MPSWRSANDAGQGGDAEVMAAILADVVERRRRGESPSAATYAAKHPHLQRAIEEDIELVALLEEAPACPPNLSTAIAALPRHLQRAIVLRSLQRRLWRDVAQELGLPEADLRREYARAIKELLVEME